MCETIFKALHRGTVISEGQETNELGPAIAPSLLTKTGFPEKEDLADALS